LTISCVGAESGSRGVLAAGSPCSALSPNLSGLWINVAFPPIGGAFFGAKAAIDSWGSGGLDVQAIILLLEGEPANFLVRGVAKCSYDS
jgi:hypothetical protein